MAIVGIDIGTQNLKAVVVDESFAVLGSGRDSYTVDHPRPGWAQQDPQTWDQALAGVIVDALDDAAIDKNEIAAIGVSGQLDGCIAVDAQGDALGPCLIWMDRRAQSVLPAVELQWLRERTGCVLDATHMGPKIRWLKRNAMGIDGARFHQPVSYMVERLTGAFVFDHGHASTSLLYDLTTREYSDELLSLFGVERTQVPAIAEATAPAGVLSTRGATLTGLLAGTPVAVGTGDDFCTPIGGGLTQPGVLATVLGTAEVVATLSPTLVIDSQCLVETHGWPGGAYVVENPGWLSGGAVTWARRLLDFDDDELFDRAAAEVPPGCDGVLFLPALTGSMAPEWNAGARGCFYGLSAAHGAGHLARAVLEGCAFASRDVASRLAELNLGCDRALIMGGGARSELWCQMRADVLGIDAAAVDGASRCAVGAAMLAAVSIGAATSIAEASATALRGNREYRANPGNSARYTAAYERYRELFAALKPIF